MCETWRDLDLRSRSVYGPYDEELICLKQVSKSDAKYVRYEVGRLETEEGVTWFRGNAGSCLRLADIRRKNTVTWARLPQK
ncbi:hypothetical protein [uncultured Dysosmobacter sp.]|uniref:hypothetical protein n=1 Tax=uncultured Dysosmobacter sp. TaxID=2591384 RepID=UPI002628669C|nr:hypothetical protein [uncultured Dysosmobacter sp.]